MTFAGADPQDFVIAFNGCLAPVASGGSCTIGVSFRLRGKASQPVP